MKKIWVFNDFIKYNDFYDLIFNKSNDDNNNNKIHNYYDRHNNHSDAIIGWYKRPTHVMKNVDKYCAFFHEYFGRTCDILDNPYLFAYSINSN